MGTLYPENLAAGIYRRGGSVRPYAVLEYIPGTELADLIEEAKMDFPTACRIIEKILLEIWIPIWGAGLRFKDCHPGNFIIGADGHVYMIYRANPERRRRTSPDPTIWKQRDRHDRDSAPAGTDHAPDPCGKARLQGGRWIGMCGGCWRKRGLRNC